METQFWAIFLLFKKGTAPSNENENEDVVGAAPTGDAPTTSE